MAQGDRNHSSGLAHAAGGQPEYVVECGGELDAPAVEGLAQEAEDGPDGADGELGAD